jgi:hypothetical protein
MKNLGGFSLDWYWSSTYGNSAYAGAHYWWAENFSDGGQKEYTGNRGYTTTIHAGAAQQFRVRAARRF